MHDVRYTSQKTETEHNGREHVWVSTSEEARTRSERCLRQAPLAPTNNLPSRQTDRRDWLARSSLLTSKVSLGIEPAEQAASSACPKIWTVLNPLSCRRSDFRPTRGPLLLSRNRPPLPEYLPHQGWEGSLLPPSLFSMLHGRVKTSRMVCPSRRFFAPRTRGAFLASLGACVNHTARRTGSTRGSCSRCRPASLPTYHLAVPC